MGVLFLRRCSYGVFAYAIIRPMTTIIALICQLTGTYGYGEDSKTKSYIYLALINGVALVWAMYCLVLFYQAFKRDLARTRPLRKLLMIKFIVFLLFIQDIVFNALAQRGVLKPQQDWALSSYITISMAVQDFTICLEMLLAAVAFHFGAKKAPWGLWSYLFLRFSVFSYQEFLTADGQAAPSLGGIAAIREIFTLKDVLYNAKVSMSCP